VVDLYISSNIYSYCSNVFRKHDNLPNKPLGQTNERYFHIKDDQHSTVYNNKRKLKLKMCIDMSVKLIANGHLQDIT